MKHLFNFLSFAAIAVMTMVSCNKELETPDYGADPACPEGYYVEELTAVYPHDPETRTAFNETTGRFAWTAGDELAFHLTNGEYVAAPIDPATGKVKLYLPVGVTRDNYAVYPASAVVDEAAAIGNMKVTLPDTYDISDNPNTDFVPTPLVAWNDAENTHLKFEHVGGLLQVNLNVPAGVKTATVSMGKTISGTFSLEDGTGNGVITPGDASDDGLTFILSEEGLAEDTEVKLLAPLPTGSYEYFEVAYDNGYEFSKDLSASPWTFSRSGGKKVSIAEENFEDPTDYFWFEALEANSTVKFQPRSDYNGVMSYSFDKRDWVEWTSETGDILLENVGDRVYWCGNGKAFTNQYNVSSRISRFKGTGRLACGGDITTLKGKDVTLASNDIWAQMFMSNTALVDASQLVISGMNAMYCQEMFYRCTALEVAPPLPATKVATRAYYGMFQYCENLLATPELGFTEVGSMGCRGMFSYCTALKTGPTVLDATMTGLENYYQMFYKCENLENVAELPQMNLTESCYCGMYSYCKSVTEIPDLPAQVMKKNCYNGMFSYTSITEGIELTADNTAEGCYAGMFSNCKLMVTGPTVLPAKTVAISAYANMFNGCASLLVAPEIEAETLVGDTASGLGDSAKGRNMIQMFRGCISMTKGPSYLKPKALTGFCYQYMFNRCISMTESPIIEAESISGSSCMYFMFTDCNKLSKITVHFTDWPGTTYGWISGGIYDPETGRSTPSPGYSNSGYGYGTCGVPATGDFYCPADLPATYGASNIPSGWNVIAL